MSRFKHAVAILAEKCPVRLFQRMQRACAIDRLEREAYERKQAERERLASCYTDPAWAEKIRKGEQ